MVLSKNRKIFDNNIVINVEEKNIHFSNKVKNLGLTIDTNLRISEHVKHCIKKAYLYFKFLSPYGLSQLRISKLNEHIRFY